jgi:hypothetical protein
MLMRLVIVNFPSFLLVISSYWVYGLNVAFLWTSPEVGVGCSVDDGGGHGGGHGEEEGEGKAA